MKLTKKTFNSYKHSKRFYRILLSYIMLVVILLMFVGSAVYGTFVKTLQKDVEESNIASLMQIRNNMDVKFREMEQVALDIYNNPRLGPYTVAQNGYDSMQAVNELKKYISSNALIQDVVVNYQNVYDNKMYASSGVYDKDVFFNRIYSYENWNMEKYNEAVKGFTHPIVRKVEPVWLNNFNKTEMATYIYPLPVGTLKPYELVIFLIRGSEIRSLMGNFSKNYLGYTYILDSKKDLFMSVASGDSKGKEESIYTKLDINNLNDGINSVVLDNTKYSVVKLTSNYNEWSYIVAMPSYQFMEKVERSLQFFKIIFLGMLFAGICLSILLAARNYKPLKKLAESIVNKHVGEGKIGNKDEIALIYRFMDEVTIENRGLMSRLKSQSGILKEQFLMRLIKGRVTNVNDLDEMMEISNIRFSNRNYAVMVISIDHYSEFENNNTKNMQEVIKFNIGNLSEELSMAIGRGYAVELAEDNGIVVLLEIDNDSNPEGHVSELACRIKEFFKEYFDFTLTIGVSPIYPNILDTGTYFIRARIAKSYRLIMGTDRVILYGEIEILETKNNWYPSDQENRLISALRIGDYKPIIEITESMVNSIKSEEMSSDNAQRICKWITNTLYKTISDLNIDLDVKFEELITLKYETLEEFVECLRISTEHLCKVVQMQKESKNFLLREQIYKYVNENYSDNTLCLERIAQHFNLSASYITRYFKDQTGYSLMKYIDMVRNDKAKELLQETNMILRDIISAIGNVDETNFIRKFKMKEGVTPSQFRNISRDNLKNIQDKIASGIKNN